MRSKEDTYTITGAQTEFRVLLNILDNISLRIFTMHYILGLLVSFFMSILTGKCKWQRIDLYKIIYSQLSLTTCINTFHLSN